MRSITAVGMAFLVLAGATAAAAQSTPYPSQPIHIIVPFAAGGATDVTARIIGQKLAEEWKTTVVIENKPGATGSIAAEYVAKSKPDGYTLLMGTGSVNSVFPAVKKNLPFDTMRDFVGVSNFFITPNILVVHPSVPAKSVQEFIAYARANAGKIDYGSTGVGISTHLSMELFKTMTGVNLVHVPYKAFALALPDLLAGRITVMVSNLPGLVDTVRSGKLRALGVTTLKRSPRLPEIPTIDESGVPGFEVMVWYGVMAPAAVPAPILNKLHADTLKALGTADLRLKLEQQGIDPGSSATREQFAAFVKSETVKWAKVVTDANIPTQ